jgi:hypothetical protein
MPTAFNQTSPEQTGSPSAVSNVLTGSAITSTLDEPCIPVSQQTQIVPDKNDPYSYRGVQQYGPLYFGSSGYAFGRELSAYQGQDYSLEGMQTGDVMVVWLEKLLCRNLEGAPYFEVLDVLVTPPMQDNEILNMQDCILNGRADTEIITVAEYDPANMKPGDVPVGPINWAWRANRQTQRFESIPVEGITCTHWIGQH